MKKTIFDFLLKNIVFLLTTFHILIIAASNYLVQIPLVILGLNSNWGIFTFPAVFLATDLTVRLFGTQHAKKVIFLSMFPAMIISYYFSVLFFKGSFQGLGALRLFNPFVARVAMASFLAYFFGQLLDVGIFNKLRKLKTWWIAPSLSTFLGDILDTLIFFFCAFYQSEDLFLATFWPEIALLDCVFKLFISFFFFIPLYGLLVKKIQPNLLVKT
jgi:queuosine precursor transporter